MTDYPNAAGLPEELLPIFHSYMTCEHATINAKGEPITYPLLPFVSDDGSTLDVSTGVTYPAKAERARRNPKTTLLYSNPTGSGLEDITTVLVYGMSAVRDSNLQANTDRYTRLLKEHRRVPPLPPWVLRRLGSYFIRIWIEVTPLRVLWWNHGDMDKPPQEWNAPDGTVFPASDPAPQGKQPNRWKEPPHHWKDRAAYAARHLGLPVLTVVDKEVFPVSFRAKSVTTTQGGFQLEMPKAIPVKFLEEMPGCLTFHAHPENMTWQENMVFMGEVVPASNGIFFNVQRCPGEWALPPRGLAPLFSFIGNNLKLTPRVRAEAVRRGQEVPKINL